MYVPLQHHRKVVFALGGGLVALSLLFVLAWFDIGVFQYERELPATTPESIEAALESYGAHFLAEEESVAINATSTTGTTTSLLPLKKVYFEYIEVIDGCSEHFQGECLNVRSGPGLEYPVVTQLRNDVVLKVDGKVERDGETWYKIVFDEWLRYPERVETDWYVAATYVRALLDEGDKTSWEDGSVVSNKRIVISCEEQVLRAYNDDQLYLETPISTGLALTPTPQGTFTIFKKTPSRYMQGPLPGLPSDQYYDMPGVPWNLYFTEGGAVIHGAYWHDSFGTPYSHGCVNLPPEQAKELYYWADLGTKVIVE